MSRKHRQKHQQKRGKPKLSTASDTHQPDDRIDFAEVLRRIEHAPQQRMSWRSLTAALSIRSKNRERELDFCIAQLLKKGQLKRQGSLFFLAHQKTTNKKTAKQSIKTGQVIAHPKGFGFVHPKGSQGREEDAFLTIDSMRELMHGDIIEYCMQYQRGRSSAKVLNIIEEADPHLIGQFRIIGGIGIVEARQARQKNSILVQKRHSLRAHDGDWVRLKMDRGSDPARGRIIEILGNIHSPKQLIDLIIAEKGLATEFDDELSQWAETKAQKPLGERFDLRQLPFVTIDGSDAKDFDDAICVFARGEGFELWVAIADVAHFVEQGDALDQQARERGNSFYFPDRVLPMLPESLSNGACSLRPHEDKAVIAIRIRIDSKGHIQHSKLYEACIRSQQRLTYEQVQQWVDTREKGLLESAKIETMIDHAMRFLRLAKKRRQQRGALDLELPESYIHIENNSIKEVRIRERFSSHQLIEELMLLANTEVAQLLERQQQPVMYRVHPAPASDKIEQLNRFLQPLGLFLAQKKAQLQPKELAKLLHDSKKRDNASVIHRLILRSLQQARYSMEEDGHFGLAYARYCHFTSPIRRYADLCIHRAIKNMLQHRKTSDKELAAIADHCSVQERKQTHAEWDTQAMLAALYYQQFIGQQRLATLSGMTQQNLFFLLPESGAEGSLDIDQLAGDFRVDDDKHAISNRHGKRYQLGDSLKVIIEASDPVRGTIRLSLDES